MNSNSEAKLSHALIGVGVGAVGGFIAALLARKENRDLLRERSAKSLAYLNEQGNKLRGTTEEIVAKGKIGRAHV